MLTLLPILINLLAAGVIFLFSRLKTNIGRAWLGAAIFSMLNWGLILALRWFYPLQFQIAEWFPFGEVYQQSLFFQLDSYSWPLMIALCAVQTAVIITDSSRLDEIPSVNVWSGVFLVYAVGFLAVLSNSIITFMLIWALVDLIEFLVLVKTTSQKELTNEIVVSFSVKTLGLMLLILGLLVSFNFGIPLQIGQLDNQVGIFVLIAVGLRMGVIPFNLPFVRGSSVRRGLGNAIRMISVSSSLIVLLRLSVVGFLEPTLSILLTLTSIGILFGSIMWFNSSNELEGRPYWIITLAGLAIYSSIQGEQLAVLSWSLVLILSGSVIFLYSARGRKLSVLPLLAIIGMSGLPFTPGVAGWEGVIVSGELIRNIIAILSVAFLILGYLQHANQPTVLLTQKEKWSWLTYPLGLSLLNITHWVIFLLSDLGLLMQGMILASAIAFVIPLIIYFLITRYMRASYYSEYFQDVLRPFGRIFIRIVSLRWLYQLIWSFLIFVQKIVNILANILEGQGGIIWVVVFLIMLITLITSGDLI